MTISRSRRVAALMISAALMAALAVAPALAQTSGVIYESEGYILASNPASPIIGTSATDAEFFLTCQPEPFLNGVDGHVFANLPAAAGDGTAVATATGEGLFGYDFDLYFYDADCGFLSSSATVEPNETATLPAGTRHVVAINWCCVDSVITLTVVSGGGDPDPTPTPTPTPSPDPTPGCTGTADHVYFLAIAYDEEGREDFKADVSNFEGFLSALGQRYCIPASQAKILAMEDNYIDPETGQSYAEGSEANLKAEIRRLGAAANQHADSQFFFFLSSHGNAQTGAIASCDPTRLTSSFSALKDGGGEDGFLDDCELGDELNSSFNPNTRMFVAVDCSFCGGFSDSLTAASGTVPDGSTPTSSGVPGPNRVVVTGCAITTECFGSTPAEDGAVLYHHMSEVLDGSPACDGWTAPNFPAVQGFDVPVRGATDGRCTASEWFFGAVQSAYDSLDPIAIQEQFRIKYGFDTLAEDIEI